MYLWVRKKLANLGWAWLKVTLLHFPLTSGTRRPVRASCSSYGNCRSTKQKRKHTKSKKGHSIISISFYWPNKVLWLNSKLKDREVHSTHGRHCKVICKSVCTGRKELEPCIFFTTVFFPILPGNFSMQFSHLCFSSLWLIQWVSILPSN